MSDENKTSGYPDNNPKTMLGVQKAPLHLVPPSAKFHLAAAFADGAKKYGPYNWREKTVSSSIYIAAAQRHMDAWWDGEGVSKDAGVHHLGHALACLAILLDAESIGMLNDDRPSAGASPELHEEFAENKKKESDANTPTTEPSPNPIWQYLDEHGHSPRDLLADSTVCGAVFGGDTRTSNTLVNSRLPDLPTNVLPEDLTGWWYRGYDGEFEYWQRPDGTMGRYDSASSGRVQGSAVSELFSERGSTFNSLYDLTQRDGSGTFPMAAGDGDG